MFVLVLLGFLCSRLSCSTWIVGSSDPYCDILSYIESGRRYSHDAPPLFINDVRQTDNLVLLGSTIPSNWRRFDIVQHVVTGGNMLYVVGETLPSHEIQQALEEFGISFVGELIDPFRHHMLETHIYSKVASVIFGEEVLGHNLVYGSAYGMKLESREYLWPSIRPNMTTVVGSVKDKTVYCPGSDVSIICHFQSSINSRISVVSSSYLVSDMGLKYIRNRIVSRELVKWTFKQKSILVVDRYSVSSEIVESSEGKKRLRVLNNIYIQAGISELRDNTSIPFVTDDIQIEMVLMKPWIRMTLKPLNVSEIPENVRSFAQPLIEDDISRMQMYHNWCQLPDRVGVFTFRIKYHKPGYSFVDVEEPIILRHYRHDENPRLLHVSLPYYTAMISMIVGCLLLVMVFLYSRPKSIKTPKKSQEPRKGR